MCCSKRLGEHLCIQASVSSYNPRRWDQCSLMDTSSVAGLRKLEVNPTAVFFIFLNSDLFKNVQQSNNLEITNLAGSPPSPPPSWPLYLPPTGSTSQLIRISSREWDAARESGEPLTQTSDCNWASNAGPPDPCLQEAQTATNKRWILWELFLKKNKTQDKRLILWFFPNPSSTLGRYNKTAQKTFKKAEGRRQDLTKCAER